MHKKPIVTRLSHEELLWKVQGFPEDAVPVQGEWALDTAAERAYTQRMVEIKEKEFIGLVGVY